MAGKSKRASKAKAAHKTPPTIIKASYAIVTDMEDDVAAIEDFSDAVAFIAQTLGEQEGCVVQRIAWMIKTHAQSIEKRRGDLFDLLHPQVQS